MPKLLCYGTQPAFNTRTWGYEIRGTHETAKGPKGVYTKKTWMCWEIFKHFILTRKKITYSCRWVAWSEKAKTLVKTATCSCILNVDKIECMLLGTCQKLRNALMNFSVMHLLHWMKVPVRWSGIKGKWQICGML